MNILEFSKGINALRMIAALSVILAIVSNGIWGYLFQKDQKSRAAYVYVAGQGGTYPARLVEKGLPTIFEARNQVKQFCSLMFGHDADTYDEHIESALYLIDKEEGMTIYEDFQKGGVRDAYIKYNSRSFFEPDLVDIKMKDEPYEGQIFGRQVIHYGDTKKEMPIGASFKLQRTRRSDKNPFGLILSDWKFILYQNEFREKGGES